MKEPDYILSFMTIYGIGERIGKEQVRTVKVDGQKRKFRFKYAKVCYCHYSNYDSVDVHNGRRMYPIAI